MIFVDVYKNSDSYINFVNDNDIYKLKQYMYSYIHDRKYNSEFGDIVPYCVVNILNVGLVILNEFRNTANVKYNIIKPNNNISGWVAVVYDNDHYDALCFNSYQNEQIVTNTSTYIHPSVSEGTVKQNDVVTISSEKSVNDEIGEMQ